MNIRNNEQYTIYFRRLSLNEVSISPTSNMEKMPIPMFIKLCNGGVAITSGVEGTTLYNFRRPNQDSIKITCAEKIKLHKFKRLNHGV
jgi:hypothetical protein